VFAVSGALTALLAALVGAAAALVGQLLAPVIQSRHAHRVWLRDKLAGLCETYVSQLNEGAHELTSLHTRRLETLIHRDPEEVEREAEELAYKRIGLLQETENKLSIYCSPELQAALKQVGEAYRAAWQVGDEEEIEAFFQMAVMAKGAIRSELSVESGAVKY
jgi:hypothetical protein